MDEAGRLNPDCPYPVVDWISAASFDNFTYIALFFDIRRLGAAFGAGPNSVLRGGRRFHDVKPLLTRPAAGAAGGKKRAAGAKICCFRYLEYEFQEILNDFKRVSRGPYCGKI